MKLRKAPLPRALILHPVLKNGRDALRTPQEKLEEAIALAAAIRVEVAYADQVPITQARPATLLGGGKVVELKPFIAAEEISLVVINHPLSPIQQRNLENAWNCKVIDRTALILEIFGARARTREGKLQVELAALEYQRSRLVRSWTHLERQRGGFGFLGGPGESQIEIDRRIIRDRIALLKSQLEKVKRTRELHRKKRRDTPYPVVALVGYTNAGKSTLFNALTGAKVEAVDKLFATLDPTMRAVRLPSGRKVILSDTVGFISDLPTQLVAAFRATLEEVLEAELILHVRDSASPSSEAQKVDVLLVLGELGLAERLDSRVIEVFNKEDLLADGHRKKLVAAVRKSKGAAVLVSAVTGKGHKELLAAIDERLGEAEDELAFRLNPADGKTLAWLYQHGHVLSVKNQREKLHVKVKLSAINRARFAAMRGQAEAAEPAKPKRARRAAGKR